MSVIVLAAALGVSFYSNVYLTLVILGLVPFIVVAGFLQMKTVTGHENANKDRLQEAGNVRMALSLYYRDRDMSGIAVMGYVCKMPAYFCCGVLFFKQTHTCHVMSCSICTCMEPGRKVTDLGYPAVCIYIYSKLDCRATIYVLSDHSQYAAYCRIISRWVIASCLCTQFTVPQIAVETIENIRTVASFGLEARRYEAYLQSVASVHV